MLFLDTCHLCRTAGRNPCSVCVRSLPGPEPAPPPAGIRHLTAAIAYRGSGKQLVGSLKYRNRRTSAAWFARRLVALVPDTDFDCVTWVPSTGKGRRSRGYDTGRVLALRMAAELGLPCHSLFSRPGSQGQTSKSCEARLEGPRLHLRPRRNLRKVLIVDDVCTTGASLSAAARALYGVGVETVDAAVAARTPLLSMRG